jgi:hypothetical protein
MVINFKFDGLVHRILKVFGIYSTGVAFGFTKKARMNAYQNLMERGITPPKGLLKEKDIPCDCDN